MKFHVRWICNETPHLDPLPFARGEEIPNVGALGAWSIFICLELHFRRRKTAFMSNTNPLWRFISAQETQVEQLPGKTHHWYFKPDIHKPSNLMFVRAILPPGEAHNFHFHPKMEEILYILSGEAEQWVEREKKIMREGDSFYVPAGIVHATFNAGKEPLEFLAILSPANSEGPVTIEVSDQEPWRSLRK